MTLNDAFRPAPWAIAHRGARDEAPENTRAAFERALTYPIDGIELDVQMSADGVPVIHHDRTLARVAGRRWRVRDLGLAQLEEMDWGGWFGPQFAQEPLLTLAQVLEGLGRRIRLMIEIKVDEDQHRSGQADRLTEKVIHLMSDPRYGLRPECTFILSFDPKVLSQAGDLAPQWRYVLNLPEAEPEAIMAAPSRDWGHLWAVDARISRLSVPLVCWAKERGLRVFTYTCNGPRQLGKALGLGVDAILSDRPGWLCAQLERVRNG